MEKEVLESELTAEQIRSSNAVCGTPLRNICANKYKNSWKNRIYPILWSRTMALFEIEKAKRYRADYLERNGGK